MATKSAFRYQFSQRYFSWSFTLLLAEKANVVCYPELGDGELIVTVPAYLTDKADAIYIEMENV
jgi:hypothetical protein